LIAKKAFEAVDYNRKGKLSLSESIRVFQKILPGFDPEAVGLTAEEIDLPVFLEIINKYLEEQENVS